MIEKALRQLIPTILILPHYRTLEIEGVITMYRRGSDEIRISGIVTGHVQKLDKTKIEKAVIMIAAENLILIDKIRIAKKINKIDKVKYLLDCLKIRDQEDQKKESEAAEKYSELEKQRDELTVKLAAISDSE